MQEPLLAATISPNSSLHSPLSEKKRRGMQWQDKLLAVRLICSMADMKNSHRSFHRHRQIALQHAA
jgi:hypothetical protein